MFTYQSIPCPRPDSSNVTEYLTRENVMLLETVIPWTANDPGDGDGPYSLFGVAIVYVYDPLVKEKEYNEPFIGPEWAPSVRLTNHTVSEGRPVSVKVTVYTLTVRDEKYPME